VSRARDEAYRALCELSNAGAKTIGKLPLEQRVRMTVDLGVVEAAQLARLATHLDRTPSDLVCEAVKELLAAPKCSGQR
jgi:hypothetical protein